EKLVIFEKRIQEIDIFEKDIKDLIENRAAGIDAAEILEVKNRTLEASSTAALAKKNEQLEELDRENKLDFMEIQQLYMRILSILSPLYLSQKCLFLEFFFRKLQAFLDFHFLS
ncbi:MAG TPA: hypothetical protein VHO90_15245, partial [Bacteroidales bacterium]|nr:hypothetical protein [Bacteroidales bacterium]